MEVNREDGVEFTFASSIEANETTVVRLGGELDISNVDALRPKLERILDDRPEKLVFELSDLRFFDSSGIALLVEVSEKVTDIELRNPSPIVRQIVEGTGLTQVLRITP